MNRQELELGILLPDGAYIYDAAANKLVCRSTEKNTSPVIVAIIWDTKKQPSEFYAAVDAGFIGQNIYLFAASNGLASVFRGGFDRAEVSRKLALEPHRKVIFVHAIGSAE
jgi:nitroreductase